GGFANITLLSIAPLFLIAGITALAKRDKKIGTIVAGVFFLIAGGVTLYANTLPVYSGSSPTSVGIIGMVLGVLHILSAILQKGMTLGPKLGNKMYGSHPGGVYPQNGNIQTFGPSHLPVQTYGQYQQPAAAPTPVPVPVVDPNLGGWTCPCGTVNPKDAKFCKTCGKPNPALETWTCACGVNNEKDAKFCKSCGKPKQ
ncbi:MAG: zinc ribbon domain-containing protein, partial [Firmicutes bacterium]|nr:zinc ribbon domain-containing protein [Bacillota bacterium]